MIESQRRFRMLSTRFDEALQFACELHRKQTRKGTNIPYIAHPLAVSAIVLEDGGSEDEAIAALLHDTVEDQGDSYPGGRNGLRSAIAQQFGDRVLEIVDGCTDDGQFTKAEWRNRKEAYLAHVKNSDDGTRRVSCADKLHNARSILRDLHASGEQTWKRFRTRNRADQLWYYGALVAAFKGTATGHLADELERVVDEIHAFCGTVRTSASA